MRQIGIFVIVLFSVAGLGVTSALGGNSGQDPVGDKGPPLGVVPVDPVAVIPQADMDGIPQPSITISKSRPIGWPAPPHLKRSRLTVTMPGDSYEGQSTDGLYTTDSSVNYKGTDQACRLHSHALEPHPMVLA